MTLPPSSVKSWIAYCATLPKPCTLASVSRRLHPEHLQRLADGVDDAVAGRFGASERPAHADRLAGDQPG